MPYHAAPLSTEQISLLRRWIKEGAKWSDYWAFVPPRPQALPAVKNEKWIRRPLDRFILARLERETLQDPSRRAKIYGVVLLASVGAVAVAGYRGGQVSHGENHLTEFMPGPIAELLGVSTGWKLPPILPMAGRGLSTEPAFSQSLRSAAGGATAGASIKATCDSTASKRPCTAASMVP